MFLAHNPLFAQNHHTIFLDSLTNEPIAYYRVFTSDNKYVGYSDSTGICYWQQKVGEFDTLFLYHISYPKFFFNLNSIKDTLYIGKLNYQISEICIKSNVKKKNIDIGCKKNKTGVNFLGPTAIIGVYISGYLFEKNAIVKTFNVHIFKDSYQPDQKFRIHLFSVDDNKFPRADILPYDVYANGNKNGGWVEIDLSKLQIKLPKEGLIAAIECLGSLKSNEIYFDNLKKINEGKKTEISYLYDIQVSSGDNFLNGNENGYWAKRGIGDWKLISHPEITLFPSIYLKVEIEK